MLKTFFPCIFIACLRCSVAKGAFSYCIILHPLFSSLAWDFLFLTFFSFLYFDFDLRSFQLCTYSVLVIVLVFMEIFLFFFFLYGWIMHSRRLKWQHWRWCPFSYLHCSVSLVWDSSSVCQVRERGLYNMFYKFKESFGVCTHCSLEVCTCILHYVSTAV